MVRTRATTVSTPTPARQGVSEPTIRAGHTPPVFSALATQFQGVQHAADVVPRMDASLEVGTFPRLTIRSIMTGDQHDLFIKFLNLKPPVFKGVESEDAYDFLGDAKMWWQSYVECGRTKASPMTWESFSSLFMEKYIPRTLRDRRRDVFQRLEQRRMYVSSYEAEFRALSRYATQLFFSPQERIRLFKKGSRSDLQIPALQVATAAKSFQEVINFVMEVEGVNPDDFTMTSTFKNFCKGGEFSGSYSRWQSSGGYPTRPILSLKVISRLHHFHRDLYLTPVLVMDVEKLDILGNTIQRRVIDPHYSEVEVVMVEATILKEVVAKVMVVSSLVRVVGTLLVCDCMAYILFDPGSKFSYASSSFATGLDSYFYLLEMPIHVSTPNGGSMIVEKVYRSCFVTFVGGNTYVDLIILKMVDFDVILGMTWFSPNFAILNCNAKTVTLAKRGTDPLVWEGDYISTPVRIISFLCAKRMDNLPGMPLDRDIDSCIDVEPGTHPISILPYRMAPAELRELKTQLQELLVSFLGDVVSKDGVMVDPSKIEAVKSWVRPTNVSKLRIFVSLAIYYRQFVKGFSSIASKLTNLTKQNVPFVWSDECEESFQKFKTLLPTAPIFTLQVLTKSCHFIPVKMTYNADKLAKLYVSEIVRLHGVPLSIISDRGTQFTSMFWRTLHAELGIRLNLSTAFHAQINGQYERTIQVKPWGTDLLRESLGKVKFIQENPLAAQSRQKKYADRNIRDLDFTEVLLDENLSYEEEPVVIIDREVRKLMSKEIASIKVQRKNRPVEESTWESPVVKRGNVPISNEASMRRATVAAGCTSGTWGAGAENTGGVWP
ncbi:uncharacterized protein [Solanum lycopersicum]|uniref:uncharacterized protein n=1 Tax=Solanum lycopersicum TaxID=4081 RepID=UPI003747C450